MKVEVKFQDLGNGEIKTKIIKGGRITIQELKEGILINSECDKCKCDYDDKDIIDIKFLEI